MAFINCFQSSRSRNIWTVTLLSPLHRSDSGHWGSRQFVTDKIRSHISLSFRVKNRLKRHNLPFRNAIIDILSRLSVSTLIERLAVVRLFYSDAMDRLKPCIDIGVSVSKDECFLPDCSSMR